MTEVLPSDERRVADDEIGHGPIWLARIGIGLLVVDDPRQGIAVPSEHCIAALDIVEGAEDGLGRVFAGGAIVNLQIADPEHQFGDGGSAGIDLDAQELVWIDGVAGQRQARLAAHGDKGVDDFVFELLDQLHGDIEEVASAAGRIEHAGEAELVVEIGDGLDGLVALALGHELFGADGGVAPVGSQRLQNRGDDEAFDIGAGRVVSAEL